MSIMNGIRKAMESADSGLQELIDEVVTHADELEEDASERMYAGMYGEDDSADISSARYIRILKDSNSESFIISGMEYLEMNN